MRIINSKPDYTQGSEPLPWSKKKKVRWGYLWLSRLVSLRYPGFNPQDPTPWKQFFISFLYFLRQEYYCDQPETCYGDQVRPHREPPGSASPILGLKPCATTCCTQSSFKKNSLVDSTVFLALCTATQPVLGFGKGCVRSQVSGELEEAEIPIEVPTWLRGYKEPLSEHLALLRANTFTELIPPVIIYCLHACRQSQVDRVSWIEIWAVFSLES